MRETYESKRPRRTEQRATGERRAGGSRNQTSGGSFPKERKQKRNTEQRVKAELYSVRRKKREAERARKVPKHTFRGRVQRDLRVDNVRGFLIILVVIGHFLLPLYDTRLITDLTAAIYAFHMPCFVMISGFYAKSIYKDGRFRWGKIVQFVWLYIIFKLAVNITEGMLSGNVPLFPDFFHESGAPWYLLALAFWYSLIPVFYRLQRTPLNLLALLLLVLGIVFGKYYVTCKDFLSMDRVLSFAPFFYLGYFCSQENIDAYLVSGGRSYIDRGALILITIIFFGSYDFFGKFHLIPYGAEYMRYPAEMQSMLWLYNLIWYAVALTISLGLIGITLNRRMLILTDLGQRTLQVYVLHRPIRDLMQYFGFYEWVNPHSKLNVLFVLLLATLLAILLGNNVLTRMFGYLKTAPDSILRKLNAL